MRIKWGTIVVASEEKSEVAMHRSEEVMKVGPKPAVKELEM